MNRVHIGTSGWHYQSWRGAFFPERLMTKHRLAFYATTHWKRLTDKSRNSLYLMESRLRIVGDKAGPVLFKMPPQFHANYDRLASFLKLLRRERRYAFEFRHHSWYETLGPGGRYKGNYSVQTLRGLG